MPEEQEEKTEEPSLKPKHRRSFNLFKRRKTDKKAEKDEEKGEEKEETGEETQESDKKEETPAEGIESHEEVHLQNGKDDEEHETKDEEKVEEESELDRKPKTRRSFNLRFRKRPKSMASADKETEDDGEETGLSRQDPVRHSYHAGDLTAPEASKPSKWKFCVRMFKFSDHHLRRLEGTLSRYFLLFFYGCVCGLLSSLMSEHTRRHVAAPSRGDNSLLVYGSGDKLLQYRCNRS